MNECTPTDEDLRSLQSSRSKVARLRHQLQVLKRIISKGGEEIIPAEKILRGQPPDYEWKNIPSNS